MANVASSFIKTWNHRTLEDWGSVNSPDFQKFQTAFINAMKKIAASMGAELVKSSRGHYCVSGFIKKNEKYVYFHYCNECGFGGRTYICLTPNYNTFPPMYVRSAANENDYHGGTNHNVAFSECEAIISKLLEP